jgi:ubiquinone/menaquinone biosynthesis C-methylase UbiE
MRTTPFIGKRAAYQKYRPDYPPEAIELLIARAGLTGEQVVADLGSGTGLLTRHLLDHARRVYAVEPAEDMRRAAEAALGADSRFQSIDGTAERTGLPSDSADAITCGNSFHYFDPERVRGEVRRVLRSSGRVVLIFHDAPPDPGPFMQEYLELLASSTPSDLTSVHSPDDFERRFLSFFAGRETLREGGEQNERLTWEELRGRFRSSSIAPDPTDLRYESVMNELLHLFERHQDQSLVRYRLGWTVVNTES